MSRLLLLASSFALTTLLAPPVAASTTANPEDQPASVKFPLTANHGLHAYVETDDAEDEVELMIGRKGRFVTYKLEGKATEAGLKARFGKLGLIDVAFEPTKTLGTIEPPKGCKGEPSTNREGLFVGIIEFTGERKYVRIEATRVKGRMRVSHASEWECSRQPKRRQGALRLPARKRAETEEETATLVASSHRCRCYFAAVAIRNRRGRDSTYFTGAKFERREGMEINRATFTRARSSAFAFDHAAGTARVRPPRPFSGSGTYKRRLHKRDLWKSSIRVPLLGAKPLEFRGRGFHTKLVRDFFEE